ncbi:DUF2358 domain-containing protein [Leptolyngbya sp. FACHB-36]|uniref:DUF2358 domain-containing protein n=1 Tax=Leptolyngbya sp. FACHB-36 TaxID=2692808 RepID=UPI00168030FB|nr:DUF2358 domain-containing protein [Leptolyngbya sp. FACHB-36]MBD2020461.1 DUF2358 domain-containing protein [Leptolyngbya sp. FACHB-36]
MDVLQILQDDYARFPHSQTYGIYADDVYFKDPMNEFRGVKRYQAMITFIETVFLDCTMNVHDIHQTGSTIHTDWTLSWNTPLPWKPRIAIPGWSELTLNQDGLITSHIDYWRCSRLNVLKQHFHQGSTTKTRRAS